MEIDISALLDLAATGWWVRRWNKMMDRAEKHKIHAAAAAVISPASNLDIGSNCEGLGRSQRKVLFVAGATSK